MLNRLLVRFFPLTLTPYNDVTTHTLQKYMVWAHFRTFKQQNKFGKKLKDLGVTLSDADLSENDKTNFLIPSAIIGMCLLKT